MYLTIAHLDSISPTSKSKTLRKWDTLVNIFPDETREGIFTVFFTKQGVNARF